MKLTATAFRSNLGVFLQLRCSYASQLERLRVNGVIFRGVFRFGKNKDTILVGSVEECKIEIEQNATRELERWALRNPHIASPLIPLSILPQEIEYDTNPDAEDPSVWVGKHSGLEGLYEAVYTTKPSEWVSVELAVIEGGTWQIDNMYSSSLRVKQESTSNRADVISLDQVVVYEDITEMLTPSFLLGGMPCKLPPSSLFTIIRNHVMENIDLRQASIESNYDTHFVVKRKVQIKPVPFRRERHTTRGNSFRPPRYETNFQSETKYNLFSMACSERYREYGLLPTLQANNIVEMEEVIRSYLGALMNEINRKIQHCPHCDGTGLLEYTDKPIPFPSV